MITRLLLVGCICIVGCNSRVDKGISTLRNGSEISYREINERILKPNCLGCHSGLHEPLLTNYAQVKANLEGIRSSALIRGTMPKRGPLPEAEKAFLQKWIEDGAPEMGDSPSPAGTGEGPRSQIRWAELQTKVLKAKCFNCHYKNNPEKISDLENYEAFIGTIGTSFYVSVITPAMPPAPKGTPEGVPNPNQLTPEEKEILSYWIIDGMQP